MVVSVGSARIDTNKPQVSTERVHTHSHARGRWSETDSLNSCDTCSLLQTSTDTPTHCISFDSKVIKRTECHGTCRHNHTFHRADLKVLLRLRESSDHFLQHGQPPTHTEPWEHARAALSHASKAWREAGASLAKNEASVHIGTAHIHTDISTFRNPQGAVQHHEHCTRHSLTSIRSASVGMMSGCRWPRPPRQITPQSA